VIWGSTWLVIKYQLGIVPPEVSVAYRFLASSLLMFGWCIARRERIRFAARDHPGLFALGTMHFAVNYVFVYLSEEYLTSGLVAVVFALMVFWNLLGAHWLFGLVLTRRLVAGAACGLAGVAFVFWPELASLKGDQASLKGLSLAIVATISASAANLYSQRVYGRGWPVLPTTAWSMLYGALGVVVYCVVAGLSFTWDSSVAYQASLVYLTLVGSVVAFAMYLTLLKRIGAGRSGYTSAVIPVIAMLISTVFEDYTWTLPAVVGMALVLVGNVLVLRR
jgi:drug/metabolite transporter (DMT)-like permease